MSSIGGQGQVKSLDLTLCKMGSHWKVFKYKIDKIWFLASEWLMNGDGKRRSRDMDQEAISGPRAVECEGLD